MIELTFDIETIPQPLDQRAWARPTHETMKYGNTTKPESQQAKLEAAQAEWDSGVHCNCALDAAVGQVACVGMVVDGVENGSKEADAWRSVYSNENWVCDGEVGGEVRTLTKFFGILNAFGSATKVIGHNILGFDLYYMARRALLTGVPVTPWLLEAMTGPSYQQQCFRDTQEMWGCGEWHPNIKLTRLCGALGVPVKTSPCSGADFYLWWGGNAEQHAVSKEYCMEDVWGTRAVYMAMTGRRIEGDVVAPAPLLGSTASVGEETGEDNLVLT